MLQSATATSYTLEKVRVLIPWADEYHADFMKAQRCEDFLMLSDARFHTMEDNGQEALIHALHYNLPRRLRQCIDWMKKHLSSGGINGLAPLAVNGNETLMQEVWQEVCKKVRIAAMPEGEDVQSIPMPPLEHVRSMWPFITTIVTSTQLRATPQFRRPSNWP